jgi:hypothetical protein
MAPSNLDKFASLCKKSIRKKWSKYGKGINYEEELIDGRAVYDSGGRKAHRR